MDHDAWRHDRLDALDVRGLTVGAWVGTDDVPTTDYNGDSVHDWRDFEYWLGQNPTATTGPAGSDMIEVAGYVYNADGM